jgi:molybdopterin molybdotransferase
MIQFDHAQRLIGAELTVLPAEPVDLADALGRVTAEAIRSPENLPPFDNSAMDGFALAGGSALIAAGREFDIGGEAAAGDPAQRADGGAWEIMTGARMPDGLDRIVPVEQVERIELAEGRARIRLRADVEPGQHLRRAGEDVAIGDELLPAGCRIGAAQQSLLAAVGIARLEVRRRPRVALICTGRELLDAPGAALADGQIRNSNGPYLAARLLEIGAGISLQATVGDQPEAFTALLEQALAAGSDLILSTGAVSMGRYDFVPQALAAVGARQVFHKVAMRPGKPLLFARLPNGCLFFGLPGNPASSAVGLRFFVEPALRAMAGLAPERPLRLPLRAAAAKKPGLRFFQKARLEIAADGRASVELLSGQASFRIRPLAVANAWAVLPEEASELAAGSPVEVHGLTSHQFELTGA